MILQKAVALSLLFKERLRANRLPEAKPTSIDPFQDCCKSQQSPFQRQGRLAVA
ncbi:hypothetical protein HMPREF1869_01065 [Bacteroidales bacterium KA00251]|nr:hypothetical protein HMPREF1869_01065 [Bacteroidales bacterium KA00251]